MVEALLRQRVESAHSLGHLAETLEFLLNSGCYVWKEPSGESSLVETRALVDRLQGLTIHIYPDEHAPPHFHVKAPKINAAFKISDGSLLKGEVDRKTRDLVEHWYGIGRPKLIEIWNATRPDGCPVGSLKG